MCFVMLNNSSWREAVLLIYGPLLTFFSCKIRLAGIVIQLQMPVSSADPTQAHAPGCTPDQGQITALKLAQITPKQGQVNPN